MYPSGSLEVSQDKPRKGVLAFDRDVLSIILVSLVTVLGAILRFYDLGAESYWLDEVLMVKGAQAPVSDTLWEGLHGLGRPPVYVILAHFWINLFGTSEAATRALSAVIGTLAIPLLYVVARKLFGRRVGLIAAFLLVVAEFQIWHAQDLRYYSLVVLLTLVSYLIYIQAISTGRRRYFALYALVSALLFLTHFYGILVIAAQNLHFVLGWRKRRSLAAAWFLAQVPIALVIAPAILSAFGDYSASEAGPSLWLSRPSVLAPVVTLMKYQFPGRHYPSHATFAAALVFLALGLVVWAMWRGWGRWLASLAALPGRVVGDASARRDNLLLVGLWLAVPILVPFALSVAYKPMYVERYMIPASLALYILAAVVIVWLRPVVAELAVLGCLAILIAPGLREYYVTDVKERWRDMAAYVAQHGQARDVVAFVPSDESSQRDSFYWYYKGSLPGCDIEAQGRAVADAERQIETCVAGHDRLWVVTRGPAERFRTAADFLSNETASGLRLREQHDFNDVALSLYEKDPQRP